MNSKRMLRSMASWLFSRTGGSNADAMLGDIEERFAQGRTHLWYYKEIGMALLASKAFGRKRMKRIALLAVVLIGVFSLGFYTARSLYFVNEEMPSADVIVELTQRHRAATREERRARVLRTIVFLEMELNHATANYRRAATVDRKMRMDNLKDKLEAALASRGADLLGR